MQRSMASVFHRDCERLGLLPGDPLIAKNVLHVGASGFGLFGTCAAVGGVLGGVHSSRQMRILSEPFLAGKRSRGRWQKWKLLPGSPWVRHGICQ